jgi:hypothetical protein
MKNENELLIIWLRHELDCEAYDRTLPGFWFRDGNWIPTSWGRSLSNKNAHHSRARAIDECVRTCEATADQWERARQYVQRFDHAAQLRLLGQLILARESP